MRFERDNSVLYVIDVQEKLLRHIPNAELLLRRLGALIQGALELDIPILWLEQYPKGLGPTAPQLASILSGLHPIEKRCFSGVCEDAEHALDGLMRNQIVVCGIEAHVCVQQTVLDHLQRDREVMLIEDAVASRETSDRKTALHRMRQEGALSASVESILFEWLKTSEAEEFRRVQALIQ